MILCGIGYIRALTRIHWGSVMGPADSAIPGRTSLRRTDSECFISEKVSRSVSWRRYSATLENGRLGDLPIANSELTQRFCAVIEVREPLTLVDLRNGGPVVMGVPTDAVRASSHRWGQKWSHAFWSHRDSPDGLIYPSRLNGETNVALYNRALHKIAAPAGGRPLLDWALEMADIIEKYQLSLVRA